MNIQDIQNPTIALNDLDEIQRQREYPLYQTVRMRKENVRRIKTRITRYGQTFDDIVAAILAELERKESRK
jgi:hypothetical protein